MEPKSTSFWSNPENNSLKMLIIVAVVVLAGFFVYKAMNNGGNTGRVVNVGNDSSLTDSEGAPVVAQQGSLIFSETSEGNNCTMTVTNALNFDQSITVSGMLAADGDCTPNAKQDNPTSQGMVDAMNAGVVVNTDPETQAGYIFSQTVSGNMCTLTITNNLNRNQSITVAGTVKGEDCVPNSKQANAISQGMVNLMKGETPVQ